jgi:putative membrane protein
MNANKGPDSGHRWPSALFSGALFLLPLPVLAQADSATEMTLEGQVLNNLHEANLMEIAAGRLAVAHGGSAAVKQFGMELVKAHGLADEQIVAMASKMNVILPSTGAPEESLKPLAALNGGAFDRAFLKMMVEDHDKAISLVQSAQLRVSNAPLAAFLKKLLPILQSHRATAVALSKS